MSLPQEGVLVALWTPTDSSGRLDTAVVRANLQFLQRKGLAGLMLLGSTGEFLRLEVAERLRFLEVIRPLAEGWPAMVNVSDARPPAVVQLGQRVRELGFASISLLAPWFYPHSQPDLAEFFARSAEAIGLPVFLYNFPERTGHRIELATISAVADRVRVAGVKQSGAEFGYHRELTALGRARGFAVLTGGETRLAEAMGLGVSGCVSGLANAVPELGGALRGGSPRGPDVRGREHVAAGRVGAGHRSARFPAERGGGDAGAGLGRG